MSYVESNLVPGETVIYETRLHWLVMLWPIALASLLPGLPGVLLLYYGTQRDRNREQDSARHGRRGRRIAPLRHHCDFNGHDPAECDGNGGDKLTCGDQDGHGESKDRRRQKREHARDGNLEFLGRTVLSGEENPGHPVSVG